jgi:hypothetical protein
MYPEPLDRSAAHFYRKKKFPIDFSANAGRTRGIERTSLVQTPAKTDEEKQS